jgi:peptidoglycan/xylan/chitin deacetylase (PgdA/CDA1 family)
VRVSILVYHRFGPVVADSMTVRTATFRWQLQYLREHGYQVIPLRALLEWRLGLGPPPPARSVVITADDGHRSVFTEMMPLVREFAVPVTLHRHQRVDALEPPQPILTVRFQPNARAVTSPDPR